MAMTSSRDNVTPKKDFGLIIHCLTIDIDFTGMSGAEDPNSNGILVAGVVQSLEPRLVVHKELH